MTKHKRTGDNTFYPMISLITIILIASGFLLLAFALPSNNDYSYSTLVTAQYLEKHPPSIPDYVRFDQDCETGFEHCIRIIRDDFPGPLTTISNNGQFRLLINGEDQSIANIALINEDIHLSYELIVTNRALHLIELEMTDDNGVGYRFARAIRTELDSDAPPAIVAIPPTFATTAP